jgi:hypothetical protein
MALSLSPAELREGIALVVQLLERLGMPPIDYGDDLLDWCQQLGRIHSHLTGLRDPSPSHARASLNVLRREVQRGSGGGQPPHGSPMLFPTTDDPGRFIGPPSRGAKRRA